MIKNSFAGLEAQSLGLFDEYFAFGEWQAMAGHNVDTADDAVQYSHHAQYWSIFIDRIEHDDKFWREFEAAHGASLLDEFWRGYCIRRSQMLDDDGVHGAYWRLSSEFLMSAAKFPPTTGTDVLAVPEAEFSAFLDTENLSDVHKSQILALAKKERLKREAELAEIERLGFDYFLNNPVCDPSRHLYDDWDMYS